MIFETHGHFDDEAFDGDREDILNSFINNKITRVVNIGADMKSSRETVKLTDKYEFIYGTVGVHPSEVNGLEDNDMEELKEMSIHPKIVAIGEIGLDYHYEDTIKEVQQKWFVKQLQLAKKTKLPVVIHSRDAASDTIRIMKEYEAQKIGGVVHCYSYSKDIAKTFLEMDYYFGIGGVITFKNAKKLKETVEYVPIENIVLETDCPYLAPEPNRGKRNTSLNIPYIANAIAQIKNLSIEEVYQITYNNALRLYKMEDK